ncbi:MAG: response regulator [Thermodesulfobacteriota bacterium]|jgi:CheY-like chemotaxis protein
MRILVIEDDENKRSQLVAFLQEAIEASSIQIAKSLQRALRKISKETFDLILLDMTLPTFDIAVEEDGGRPRIYGGREILRQMERNEINTPVIMVTQFDRFGKGADSLTLKQLDSQLQIAHSKNYAGSVFYNPAVESWKPNLRELIDKSIKGGGR